MRRDGRGLHLRFVIGIDRVHPPVPEQGIPAEVMARPGVVDIVRNGRIDPAAKPVPAPARRQDFMAQVAIHRIGRVDIRENNVRREVLGHEKQDQDRSTRRPALPAD